MYFASLVLGLAGFGIALVAMAFLPYLMSPVAAIVVLTIYALVFSVVALIPLRDDVTPRALGDLVLGSVVGTPFGVWALATLPVSGLNRLIGLMLLVAVALELRGVMPQRVPGRAWGLGDRLPLGADRWLGRHAGPARRDVRHDPGLEPAHAEGERDGLLRGQPGGHPGRLLVGGPADARDPDADRRLLPPRPRRRPTGMALFTRLDPARFRRLSSASS